MNSSNTNTLIIRRSTDQERDEIVQIVRVAIKNGDKLAYSPDSTYEEVEHIWFSRGNLVYVAIADGVVVGTFRIRTLQPYLGNHVCNAGFIVGDDYTGKGYGTAMGKFSLVEAKRLGYLAMQFNFVVDTNSTSIKIWDNLGFTRIGKIPKAFRHKTEGLTDVWIMHKEL